jgi:hypothetical protein
MDKTRIAAGQFAQDRQFQRPAPGQSISNTTQRSRGPIRHDPQVSIQPIIMVYADHNLEFPPGYLAGSGLS